MGNSKVIPEVCFLRTPHKQRSDWSLQWRLQHKNKNQIISSCIKCHSRFRVLAPIWILQRDHDILLDYQNISKLLPVLSSWSFASRFSPSSWVKKEYRVSPEYIQSWNSRFQISKTMNTKQEQEERVEHAQVEADRRKAANSFEAAAS